jgi:hypothetical protein
MHRNISARNGEKAISRLVRINLLISLKENLSAHLKYAIVSLFVTYVMPEFSFFYFSALLGMLYFVLHCFPDVVILMALTENE